MDIFKSILNNKINILIVLIILQFVSIDSDRNYPPSFFKSCVFAETSDRPADAYNTEAYLNYDNLRKIYIKWNKGLFKSKRLYKRFTTKYCIGIIGKQIRTDYNYILISPEGRYEKELACKLLLGRWLQIQGDIKHETLIKIVKKKPELLTKWWRSKKLL